MTGATLNPYTFTTNRRPGPEPWSSQAGRASLIRQPAKNNLCCLIYKRLRLLRKRPHFRPLFLLQHPRRSQYVPIIYLITLTVFHSSVNFTFCITFCNAITFIMQFFTFTKPDFDLNVTISKVNT